MAVRTRMKETAVAVGGDARIEEELEKAGLKWTFTQGVMHDQFDQEKSLKNQARVGKPLNETRVHTYAEAMRKGDKFPPVVAYGRTGAFIMADGNHRLGAAIESNKPLDVYHVTGPSDVIQLYTYRANTKHGLPTSEEERIQHAIYLMDSGVPMAEAAQALSVPMNLVKKASAKKGTDRRFAECNIPLATIEKLPESTKWRLAQISTDEGFAAAVELTQAARLNIDEVFTLVTEVNALKSSPKQVAYVKDQYDVYTDKISATGGGVLGKKTNTPKGRVAAALTTVMNLPENLDEVSKLWAGPERDEAAKRMRATARRLNEMARVLTS